MFKNLIWRMAEITKDSHVKCGLSNQSRIGCSLAGFIFKKSRFQKSPKVID